MSTYQCSVCFSICDLNLEVIEKFQANNCHLPHWEKDCTICPWKFLEICPGMFGRMVSALCFWEDVAPCMGNREFNVTLHSNSSRPPPPQLSTHFVFSDAGKVFVS